MRVLGQDIEGMGHVREAEGEVLVAGDVQGHAPLPVNMRGLPNAFGGQAPRRVASDLPAGHTLEMDGRPHDDADGGRLEEVPSSCKRRHFLILIYAPLIRSETHSSITTCMHACMTSL